ncbi:hypothetical protein A3H65_03685 [Candidatus Giovannonibacteria bacterium RIFCSPLOWO2_02_FULL_45_14]|uniref:Uncharacterized protein n=1 Tax=Candidatus Giovannonibacteria bacterium RIFCSPLOWO2_12_FULL_44_15 TaxID=1798364 RepID=A0A1F5Y0D0_9BACT|nr:MAG: hypothetical protein A3C75_03550 [Candidatus Giovannonibacteria bacterium RIFCSPHIGHO2_02_FULL_44_31]OGF75989.1 MAG: hypothetical protein A3E62_01650 [Candidatus Giovannonibacteria bacterium RIFCSPHIGHO2_12_FULL_44_29]OGF90767.1 MAG: hypothetical protein A3H65_03685 [Candidatus Giovannonibacteria bacterium RIFCSPLOWO2_02_FULL_45_14]OGF93668.1 MAG: hypothetical protein A3G54_03980 [Candidatus Giovannonibacteria bacterium RIFCSPLOWO2_12_FULL_44_15]
MIKTLIIIILLIVVVSLLGVSIGDLTHNQKLKDNFSVVWNFVYPWAKIGWGKAHDYIWTPILKAARDLRG